MQNLFHDPAAAAGEGAGAEFDWSGGGYRDDDDRRLDPLPEFPLDDYRPDPFLPTPEIERIQQIPRYGYPDDFTDAVVNGSGDQRTQYLIGLTIGSLVVLCIFVVWSIVLIVLKCCGRKRVGCASGVPTKPLPPTTSPPHPMSSSFSTSSASHTRMEADDEKEAEDKAGGEHGNGVNERKADLSRSVAITTQIQTDNEQYQRDEYEGEMKKFRRRILWTRVVFLIAGSWVIVGTILFFVMGIGSLVRSLTDVQSTLDYSQVVLDKCINITERYISSSGALKSVRDQFWTEMNLSCPSIDGALAGNEEFDNVKKGLATVADSVANFNDELEKQADNIRRDLIEVRDGVSAVNEGLDKAYPFLYTAAAISAVLIVIAALLMTSVILAWKRRKVRNCFVKCIKNAVVIPIFIFFMVMAWLFATLFLLFAIGGSDFCVTPDESVAAVLDKMQEKEPGENILIELLKFYVLGCDEANAVRPQQFQEGAMVVRTLVEVIHAFVEFLTTPDATRAIQAVCSEGGNNTFSTLNSTATILHGRLHVVVLAVNSVLNVLSCSTMSPLYTGIAHDALCVNGVNGLVWIYSTQITIAICCMIMITLRAAMQEIEEDSSDDDDDVARNILVPAAVVAEEEEDSGGAEEGGGRWVEDTVTGDRHNE